MKKIGKILLFVMVSSLLSLGAIYLVAWKSPAYFEAVQKEDGKDSIVRFKDYPAIAAHSRPYIIEKNNLIIFGATHTKDPHHEEIKLIEQKWKQLKPTVALVEGRLGFLLPGFMDPVKTLGEGGKVKQLASHDNVPIYNWDLSKEILAAELQKKFNAEQIALAQILNPYFSTLRHGKPASPENFIQEFFKRAAFVGLQDSIKTSADIDRLWKKYLPNEKDWRETSDEHELPGYLAEMMSYTNDLRNKQLVSVVKTLQQKGEKIFLICGSSHAACVEPAFKSLSR